MILLNLILLALGVTSTLAAFGGDTWEKGDKPLGERITRRGWLSLACLVLALVAGIGKEFSTVQQEQQQTKESQRAKDAAAHDIASLRSDLSDARKDAHQAQEILTITKERLEDANRSLAYLRKDLTDTRGALKEESIANVVTAFAGSDVKLKSLLLFLPFTATAHRGTEVVKALLPAFKTPGCADFTGVEVEIRTDAAFLEGFDLIRYFADAPAAWFENSLNEPAPGTCPPPRGEHSELQNKLFPCRGMNKSDAIVDFSDDDLLKAINLDRYFDVFRVDQRSSNGLAYVIELDLTDRSRYASDLYAALQKPYTIDFFISVGWPPLLSSFDAYETVNNKYPRLVERSDSPSLFNPLSFQAPYIRYKPHPYPAACRNEVEHYFKTAFDKAMIVLTTDQNRSESIYFRLKASSDKADDGLPMLSFSSYSEPYVSSSEFKGFLTKTLYEKTGKKNGK